MTKIVLTNFHKNNGNRHLFLQPNSDDERFFRESWKQNIVKNLKHFILSESNNNELFQGSTENTELFRLFSCMMEI